MDEGLFIIKPLDSCNSVQNFFFHGSHKNALEKFKIDSRKEVIDMSLQELSRVIRDWTLWTSVILQVARS